MKFINIINWEKLFRQFGSFNPTGDTEILKEQEYFGSRYAIMIKKTWLALVPSIINILVLGLLSLVNIYLLYYQFNGMGIYNMIVIPLLLLNTFYSIIVFFYYLFGFKKINRTVPKVQNIYTWIQRSDKSDKLFHNFFNQLIFNIIFLVILAIISFIYIFYHTESIIYGAINILLFGVQIYQLYRIKTAVNNQEMDFVIITPEKFNLYDQRGYSNISNHDFPTIKIRNVRKTYGKTANDRSYIGSFFNFGTLIFLLEGGEDVGPTFTYTPKLTLTAKQVALFVDNVEGKDMKKYLLTLNKKQVIIPKILFNLGIDIDENIVEVLEKGKYKKEISEYIRKNKEMLLTEFENGNEQIKKEIEDLGKKYI